VCGSSCWRRWRRLAAGAQGEHRRPAEERIGFRADATVKAIVEYVNFYTKYSLIGASHTFSDGTAGRCCMLSCSAKERHPLALSGRRPKSRTAVTTIGAPAAARLHITAAARVALFAAGVMTGDSY